MAAAARDRSLRGRIGPRRITANPGDSSALIRRVSTARHRSVPGEWRAQGSEEASSRRKSLSASLCAVAVATAPGRNCFWSSEPSMSKTSKAIYVDIMAKPIAQHQVHARRRFVVQSLMTPSGRRVQSRPSNTPHLGLCQRKEDTMDRPPSALAPRLGVWDALIVFRGDMSGHNCLSEREAHVSERVHPS